MQKTIENGITVLTADVGMKLTNGDAFGSVVRLGVHDNAENWTEITEAEAEELQARMSEDDELTETEQKAKAYDILMGVSE